MNQVLFKSQSVEWPTPRALYNKLHAEFNFDFDPCPIENVNGDGLATLFVSWRGKRVYCNPPYGRTLNKWLERGPEAELAIYLLPARTDTRWFHELCLPLATEIRFIKGRLRFGEAQNGAPFPSMLVIYNHARRI
jgi:site-specific DNA-methyltransferase (adenine-specific)